MPAVAAGLVLFVWGFVSHAVLGWQDRVWHGFTDETAIARALAENAPRTGVYHLPYADDAPVPDGLRAFVAVVHPGSVTTVGGQVAAGVVTQMLSVFLVIGLLSRTPDLTFWGRVGFFSGVGMTIGFVSHAYYWNWFGFPASYVGVVILDTVIGWTLAGVVVARFARGDRRARI